MRSIEAPPWALLPPGMALLPLPESPPPVADMPEEEDMPVEEPKPEEEDMPEDDRLLELSPVPLMPLLPRLELPVLPEVGKGLEVEAMVTLLCFRTLGVSAPADGRTWHAPMPAYTASGRPQGAR
jgi:hypothetical protein